MKGAFLTPLVIVSIGIIIVALYISRVDLPLQERYSLTANKMLEQTQTLIDEKKEAVLLIAIAMSHDQSISESILSHRPDDLNLHQLSKQYEQQSSLNSLWFQVIKNNGTSFYRSWTKKRGDDLSSVRLDVSEMLNKPQIISSMSTGKFDLTFKAMVPIYNKNEFIGIFEVIAKFNSIATKLEQEKIYSVFLVDPSYKKQLTKAYTKRFIDEYYVANKYVNDDYLKIVQEKSPRQYIMNENIFQVDEQNNLLAVYYALPDLKNKPMGHFILFKSLNSVPVGDIYLARNQFILGVIFFIIFLFVIIRNISTKHLTNKMKEINVELEEKVLAKNKELIEQGNFLQSILDGVSNSVMVIDDSFNVTMMNKQAQKTTGYNPNEKGQKGK